MNGGRSPGLVRCGDSCSINRAAVQGIRPLTGSGVANDPGISFPFPGSWNC
jgi:hypothetical protein